MEEDGWDHQVDVLVVGSGAGGLTAAVAAAEAHGDVLVIEKTDKWGGTSATSGGGIWIPDSPVARAGGHVDSAAEAFAYVRPQVVDNVPDALIRAYLEKSSEMLEWLHRTTPVRYVAMPYPDYRAEMPGGKTGFRTHLPEPFDGRRLGVDVLSLRPASPAASLFGLINWRFDETYALLLRPPGWLKTLGRILRRYAGDMPHRLRSTKDRYLTLGNALTGGLRHAMNARGVPLWLEAGLVDLIGDGSRITGAAVSRGGRVLRIHARRGVILAAGGFERNAALRARHLRGTGAEDPRMSGSQTGNTGDAILAADRVGAAFRNMHSVWAAPVFRVPGEERSRLSTVERALPGCIIVNQAGRRYMNEAISYHDAGLQMAAHDRPGASTQPSWVIFDRGFRRKYPMGPLLPLIPDALQAPGVRRMIKKAKTLDILAERIGVLPAALAETIRTFNADAARGIDTQFGRGAGAYDRMYGDPRVQPNPNLAPIVDAPFYAVPIYYGDIGTNGGIVTDPEGRALDEAGRPIEGLYAIGNCAASSMGESYPGAGVTLGPAMTFGYVAARHAMGAN